MNVNEEHGASRQFVAQPPFWGAKVASITTPAWQKNPGASYLIMAVGVVAVTAVIGGAYVGLQSLVADRTSNGALVELVGRGFPLVLVALLFGGVYLWTKRSHGRTIVLSAT